MNDLIFVLNEKESKKNGLLIIESYLCNNKVNAKNKYTGGLVRKVNIYDELNISNFSDDEYQVLYNLFKKKTYNISLYQYIISVEDFCILLNRFLKKKIFYFTTYKQDINLIGLYKVDSTFLPQKKDVLCCISGYDLWYSYNSNELIVLENESNENVLSEISPEPKILINGKEYQLMFDYDGIEMAWGTPGFVFKYENKCIVRQYDLEYKYEKKAEKVGLKRKKGNSFFSECDDEIEDRLSELGFKIERCNSNKKKVRVEVIDTKNDWFDLKLYYDYDNETIELGHLIDLYSNKNTVLVNGERIDIPKSIVDNATKIVNENNELKIPKKNIWTLLQIANENHINLGDYISYNNINVEFDKKVTDMILDYQILGTKWLKWLYLNQLGGCLADDMGIGKTFQTIAFLSDKDLINSINKVLIIVPYVLLTNWVREFKKFTNEESLSIYHGENRNEILKSNCRIIITTYATAASDIDILCGFLYDVVIYDEIQFIKNSSAKTYKALRKLESKCRIGLSGTPLENKIDELWGVLSILNPEMLIEKKKFIEKYKNNNITELHTLMAPLVLRRTKEEVLKELPEKNEEIIYCDFTEQQRRLYDAIKVAIKESMRNSNIVNNGAMLKGLLLLRQACCHTKLLDESVNVGKIDESSKFTVLKMKVEEIVSSGYKVVIFSQFTSMLHLIESWLQQENHKYFYLDGQTRKRQNVIDSFEKSEEGVFLISLKAGGVGLNLTSANYAILYEPWWNPFAEHQAEDRLFRIGQKQNVTIYKMIINDSIEEKILELQTSKIEMFSNVMEGMNSKDFDMKEFIELL